MQTTGHTATADRTLPPAVSYFTRILHTHVPDIFKVYSQDPSCLCLSARTCCEEQLPNSDLVPHAASSIEEQRFLNSLAPFALNQASLLRQLVGCVDERPSKIVAPEVLNTLFVFLRQAYPEDEFRTYCRYAVARPLQSGQKRPVPRLYKRAEMIVRLAAEPCELTPNSGGDERAEGGGHFDDEEDDNDEEEEAQYTPHEYDSDAYYSWSTEEPTNPSSSQFFVRPSVHTAAPTGTAQQLLYTGDLRPQPPTLTCVAHADEITSLLTSALLHRRAIGVEGPLVGLSFRRTNPVVDIYIAWLDDKVEEGFDLPIVHFAPTAHAAAAVDLRNPAEACRLALFLHRAGRVAKEDAKVRLNAADQRPWRADLDEEGSDCHADYSIAEYVAMWASQVCEEKGNCEDEDQAQSRKVSDEVTVCAVNPAAKGRSGHSPAIRTVATGFAATRRFLVTRGVVFCSALTGWKTWAKVPREYVQSTSLLWFCDNPAETVFKSICTEQERLAAELLEAHARNLHAVLGYMTEGIQKVVERSLCAVLQVVQMARTTDALEDGAVEDEGPQACQYRHEAAYRHQWDQLLYAIVSNSGVSDIGYERQATLRYAKSSLPLNHDPGDLDHAIGRMFQAVHPPPLQPGQATQSQARYEYWLGGLQDTTPSSTEPSRGMADGVLHLTIPGVFSNAAAAINCGVLAPVMDTTVEVPDIHTGCVGDTEPPRYPANTFAWRRERSPPSDADRAAYQRFLDQAYPRRESCEPRTTKARSELPSSPDACGTFTPFTALSVVPDPCSQPPRAEKTGNVKTNELHPPFFVCQHKRPLESWTTDFVGEQRRHLAAICTFLRFFNLRSPVFGLVTNGPEGVISCAWNELLHIETDILDAQEQETGSKMEEHTPAVFIADQDAVHVDLRNPLDALNAATFIAYLMVEYAPRLRTLFDGVERADDSVVEYLLDGSKAMPIQIARSMSDKDEKGFRSEQADVDFCLFGGDYTQ